MWDGIPVQGNFAVENLRYAQKTIHPDDLETFNIYFSREALIRQFEKGRTYISRRLRRMVEGGDYHMVEFTAAKISRTEEGEFWCVLVFRDVQDEYLAEQQRNIEVSQLATAARTAYQMLIAVNLTRNTYHMLEYGRFPVQRPDEAGSFDMLIEQELSTVHPDYREEFINKFSRESLTDVFARGERIITMEVPHLGVDGTYHWHFTQVVGVESPFTDDLIEITLSRNIDEERRIQEEALEKERKAKLLMEETLKKAEKASQAKSDFLSRMSHDIRTPLNAIIGMTELAQLHLANEERMKDYLSKIAGSGAHLLGLVNEVLDVSKIESGAVQLAEDRFDLFSIMRETAEMVRLSIQNKGQVLTVDIEEALHSEVTGDERRLRQVLVNILDNASKYTEKGGRIFFRLRELKKDEQHIGTYQFIVEDDGTGMKPEYLRHIFEPFSRADESRLCKITGTGLGMTIVQNIVAMMGGDIQVESEYGKGSRFTVTLCLTQYSALESDVLAEELPIKESFPGIRVLLAEDNAINRQIATEMLELLNVQVETVENGQEAVEAVCRHPSSYYSMVFMDIQMPVLNGYDAVRKIRDSGKQGIEALPIIAMTADAFAEDVKQARLAGMNGHLPKPVSIDRLKSVLTKCLEWKKEKPFVQ